MKIFADELIAKIQEIIYPLIAKNGRCSNKEITKALGFEENCEPAIRLAVCIACPDLYSALGKLGGWKKK